MKTCIYCGKPLPDEASWCPYCEKAQTEVTPLGTPARFRRLIIICLAVAALIAAAAAFIFMRHKPKVYEGGANVSYDLGGTSCDVFLAFVEGDVKEGKPRSSASAKLPPGEYAMIMSRLSVRSDQDPTAQERFASLVENCSVSASPENGAAPVTVGDVLPGASRESKALWLTDIEYSTDTGSNTICWEVTMKNKDVIRLYQTVSCEEQPTLEYHWEDTPMETVEDIEALLEKTAAEDPDAVLNLYLPPVEYDRPLVMKTRTANLYGYVDDELMTVFTDTVRVETRAPQVASFTSLAFRGEGKTGIISTDSLLLSSCEFVGLDTGVLAQDGSWVYAEGCAFVRNKTGFEFNSTTASSSSPSFPQNRFLENETAVRLLNIPGGLTVTFDDCTFENNQTDLDDPKNLGKIQ